MTRRVFISHEGHDRNQAKGFNLLRWNKNVDVEFVGRHLIDPVDSSNAEYIEGKIKEQIKGTSVTVVLLGEHTAESDWVAKEIQWSLEKENPNGVLGIRLNSDASVPAPLVDCGAEIINWDPQEFNAAFERAVQQARRAIELAEVGSAGGRGCLRS